MLQATMNSMFKGHTLSEWLVYNSYDTEHQLYYNSDNTFGFITELAPTMFVGSQLLGGITSLLEQEWPKDALIQVMLYGDPNMEGIIDRYVKIRERLLNVGDPREEFLYKWTQWQADYLRLHRHKGISNHVPVPFRNFRCFVTVKVPCSRGDLLGRSTKTIDQLYIQRDNINGIMHSNHIPARNLGAEGLIQFLWQVFNLGHPYLEENFWDSRRPIRDQVIAPDTEIVRENKTILLDGHRIAVKIPQVYPQQINSFQSNQLIGDLLGSNLQQLCCPFLLTLNIDPMSADKGLNMKAEISGMQKSAFRALSPRTNRKNQEFSWAAEMQESGGKFVRGYLSLVLFDTAPADNEKVTHITQTNLSRHEAMCATVWGNNGFRLQNEIFAALEFFLAALPFGLYRRALANMNRMVTAPAETFAILAPLQADWRGTEHEAMLFLTRRGQLCALDFFDSDTNYNFAVSATSGAGKSFLVNKVLQEHAGRRGQCYVIDVGRSYKKQCELQMGQYLEFDESQRIDGRPISVNVFSELTLETFTSDALEEEEEAKHLSKNDAERRKDRATLLTLYTQILGVMANPNEAITDLEQAIISNAIIEAYTRMKPGQIMEVDNFVEVLEEWQRQNDASGKQDHLAGQIALRLKKYCRHGEYGHWFRGRMNVDFNKPFVVLELENLNAVKDLREVILLLLISIIERKFYHGDRNIKKIILLDEAWDLFRNPNTALFIERSYRRMRKYNGSIGTIVQSYLDFANKGNAEVGNAIISNSAWKLMLQPKSEELKECVKRNLLSLTDAELRIAETVRTTKGSYSEVMLLSSRQSSVFRFIPTQAELTAFTTLPQEVQLYDDLRAALLAEGEEPQPLTMLGYSAYGNHLMDQGATPEEAIRITLENRELAVSYADERFAVR